MKFRWLEEIALAPDGSRVAYSVRAPDAETNGYRIHVYLRHLESGVAQRLTAGASRASSLAWSRDSAQLAWNQQDAGGNSLRILRLADARERDIPLGQKPVSGLDWAPDGIHLAAARWTPMRHPLERRGPQAGVPAPTIKVIRRLRYKRDGLGWVHDRYQQIVVINAVTGDLQQLTHSECDYSEPAWSLDGTRLAFVATAREQDIPAGQGQIYLCDWPPGPAPRPLLPDWQGSAISPAWGNDDRHIAFAGHNHAPPVNRRNHWHICVADVEAGTAAELDETLDAEVGNYGVSDQRPGLSNVTVKWAPGDRWFHFQLTERGAANLWRGDAEGRSERLTRGESTVVQYSPAPGGLVACAVASPSSPGELVLWRAGRCEQLTDLNPWLRDLQLSPPESYEYEGLDGVPIHSWLMRPLNFDPQRRYPLVLYVHCSMFCWDFNHEHQIYANSGFAVAYFNQRGTTAGYGQEWTWASQGDQGGADYRETMLGVDDLLQRHPWIDGERMGVTGGSCGGFMTNWIVGHTQRFAAAVAQRSITNNLSHFGTSDIGPERWTTPEEDWRQSPIAYMDDCHTPLLIIHSDEDHRTSLEQAEQLYGALRWRRRPVEMVIFEGENHGLSTSGRPGNRIERLHRIRDWFLRYLAPVP